jgi:hypothetical protein
MNDPTRPQAEQKEADRDREADLQNSSDVNEFDKDGYAPLHLGRVIN